MTRRQTTPTQWLIIDRRPMGEDWQALGRLPRGSGVILLQPLCGIDQRRVHRLAAARGLTVMVERPRTVARIHDQRELTHALLARARLILISPIERTRSHPGWKPLPRMQAATLARLTGRAAVALGGMNRQRYLKIATLGFVGWAGISAFRT